MIRVFKTGAHAHRTPLSYPALSPLFAQRIMLVDTPSEADLYVFAHTEDLQTDPWPIVEDWRRRRRPIVIFSEEPFWDTIWGRDPLSRARVLDTDAGLLPVTQINHTTSDVYRYDHLPYYLLTNPRFLAMYRDRFTRNAALGPADWKDRFARYARHVTFMFERRPERYHNVTWPQADLIGLCAWRTDLAEALGPEQAECLGESWQGGQTRFELADWYGDKMRRLDGHTRMLGAVENTHHPDYLTEKLFDAFACGSMPLYYARPGHRVHALGLPDAAWLNLADLSPDSAAERIREVSFNSAFFDAFRAAQHQLWQFFMQQDTIRAERDRLARAVPQALQDVLDTA